MSLYIKDSIVALATPRGVGALSVVRVSGESLKPLFLRLTGIASPKSRYSYYSKLLSEKRSLIDRVVIVFFKSPSSYTGEDVIEISCHGGEVVANKIINTLIFYGCRQAEQGEFSKRAFLNGKIDLLEAESINSLVSSRSAFGVKNGLMGLEGKVRSSLKKIKKGLVDVLTHLEYELDFSEEEISHKKKDSIKKDLKKTSLSIRSLFNSTIIDKKLSVGFRVCLVGPSNAGKSTLFNSILGFNKSIVFHEKGTTRDSVEGFVEIGGFPVVLVDTAGFWKGKDVLDKIGVEKTIQEIHQSDLVVVVHEKDPVSFLKNLDLSPEKPVICALSKSDLLKTKPKGLSFSSLKNKNINTLLTKISTEIGRSFFKDSLFVSSERQSVLIKKALASLDFLYDNFNSLDPAQCASSVRDVLESLEEVLGRVYNEDILNDIFSQFCVGK
tara:strand:- start:146 stop:1465 length:1320 start_codon:yes stop_codon:yes gene_type:complete